VSASGGQPKGTRAGSGADAKEPSFPAKTGAVRGGVDQIDLTGPFEVLSRIPNATYRVYGKTAETVRD
jgi:hypothetical protein